MDENNKPHANNAHDHAVAVPVPAITFSTDHDEPRKAADNISHPHVHYVKEGRAWMVGLLFVRVAGLIVCGLAFMLMITSRQTKSIITLQVTAKFTDSKALVAVAAATAVGAAYLMIQTLRTALAFSKNTSLLGRSSPCPFAWLTFLGDQLLSYLLLGAAAAATEVADVAKNGSSKVNWSPLCQNFRIFCSHAGAAIVLTHLAVVVMAISSAISAFQLFSQYHRVSVIH